MDLRQKASGFPRLWIEVLGYDSAGVGVETYDAGHDGRQEGVEGKVGRWAAL